MRIGRSTFYDTPDAGARDLTIVAEMKTRNDGVVLRDVRRAAAFATASECPVDGG